jgi:hypothetical protein
VFVYAALIVVGLFIGLIIGVILLFLLVGGLNAFLSEAIWNLSIDDDWQTVLGCGFYLTVILILVHIPTAYYSLMYKPPSVVVMAALFVIYSFIDGFLARMLAPVWRYKGETIMRESVEVVEDKIKLMTLDELYKFEDLLNKQCEQRVSAEEPSDRITPLIYLRGKVESEIKSRTT